VETFVTTRRNAWSECFSREAWRLLNGGYEKMLGGRGGVEQMQMGAYFAGAAIEASMLGATHACANPLTARYGTIHGHAIAILLPHVVRWNSTTMAERYRELHSDLPARLSDLARSAGLPATLRDAGAGEPDVAGLADDASKQWTGKFNPRPFDAAGALEIYRCAF
jgi:alcohol dehydrogenase